MRLLLWLGIAGAGFAAIFYSFAALNAPPGHVNDYPRLIRRAVAEGELNVYSVTDRVKAEPVITAFKGRYPSIRIQYHELSAEELYQRAVRESRSGQGTADLLWSSAMDLQVKFVNDGYAQPHESLEKQHLPDWAVWKGEAYGTTAEPIVFAYNRTLMAGRKPPGTHSDLRRFLTENRELLQGRVATYDPTRSAVGYLYLSQDEQAYRDTWDLVRAMAANDVRLFTTTNEILSRLADGKLAVAYNVVGSYALEAQHRYSQIEVVLPRDYTLIMSRIAVIPKAARHPNAGKLFLDFLLSREAQTLLADHFMVPVRNDIPQTAELNPIPGSARAIRVGPALLVTQDQLTRQRFYSHWRSALQGR